MTDQDQMLERLKEENLRLRGFLVEANREVEQARIEVAESREATRLADARAKEAFGQLKLVRSSVSWKVLEPWRLFQQKFGR